MGQILAKEYIARKYKEEAPGLVFFSRKHQLYRIEGRWITRKEFHAVLREAKDALASDQAQPSSIEAAPPADLPPDYVSPQLGVIEVSLSLLVLLCQYADSVVETNMARFVNAVITQCQAYVLKQRF